MPSRTREAPPAVPWDNRDLPLRFRRYTLSDAAEPIQKAVMDWIATPDVWSLYLWGGTGGRKTTLATAVLMKLREISQSPQANGKFLPTYRAVRQLRDMTKIQTVMADWNKTRWLIIDDLGKHRDTPHIIESMLHLLHERYDCADPASGQRTIITANMSLEELATRIDPATARRLEEGTVLHLRGPKDAREEHGDQT